MLSLLGVALAADLTWTCAEPVAAADAVAWRDVTDLGTEDLHDRLLALALAWVDASCLSDCLAEEPYADACEAGSCTTSAGAWVEYRHVETDGDDTYAIEIQPEGEAWTRLTFASEDVYASSSHSEWSTWTDRLSWSASWDGTLEADLPDDGAVSSYRQRDGDSWTHDWAETWVDGTCAWMATYLHQYDGSAFDVAWSVEVGGHTVDVTNAPWSCSENAVYVATGDGVVEGPVDDTTWLPTGGTDADGDYWTVEAGDCDDTNAAVHDCTVEVPYNGLDDDCAGGDRTDADSDGHDALAMGGDDCDDADPDTYPGALEQPYDGVDQDCDGADLVDRDGDGWDSGEDCNDLYADAWPGAPDPAHDGIDQDCDGADNLDGDGDGRDAATDGGDDCDDRDPDVHAGAPDVECDGVDQDCDGADLCDADTGDPAALPAPDGDADEGGGCGSGGEALLLGPLVPLAGRRRRRTSR